MFVPGVLFSSGRVDITSGNGQAADFRGPGGFGFMNDGTLAVDTAAPSGSRFIKGFLVNSSGAVFGTTTPNASDTWIEGVRVSSAGAIVFEAAAATGYASGNPVTSNGRFGTA